MTAQRETVIRKLERRKRTLLTEQQILEVLKTQGRQQNEYWRDQDQVEDVEACEDRHGR
jgi:hypothetical protein